jgi:ATP-dependent Clp protease ATP-binding subunit ClpC
MVACAADDCNSRGHGDPGMIDMLDLSSLRARKARAAGKIGRGGFAIFVLLAVAFGVVAGVCFVFAMPRIGWFTLPVALACAMLAYWYAYDLALLPPQPDSLTGSLAGEALQLIAPGKTVTPQSLWHDISKHWHARFFMNRLLLSSDVIEQRLSTTEADLLFVWQEAQRLRDITQTPCIEPGHIAAALMLMSPSVEELLRQNKLSKKDVEDIMLWLGRALELSRTERPYFGGIGRDWANGFTPQLDKYGVNVSLAIERGGGHFGWLAESNGVQAMKNAFSQGTSAIALIGDSGVGKTSHVYGLAQNLLEERHDLHLEHRQIISLNASSIIAHAQQPGDLEHIMLTLLNETVQAGHIILFFDDAQLFLHNGPGSFDMSQILLPIVQGHSIQMVLAMNPHDYQQLKATNAGFANQLTPVMLQEPAEHDVMRVLEDTTLGLEHRHKVLIAYEALREAYVLSGRYDQDRAYPGKAISLLEQSLPYAVSQVVSAVSVQQAIERTRGVKVGAAAPTEADELLHLEDIIHQRMINQSRAVGVVSSALRRARAGVANPKRPIGSFLFLGPTGVGKTELAKAIAATYFKSESNMVRLDMSEYQQPDSVNRLLSVGENETSSLLMSVRQQPFTVVLLDEIEKAHPNVLNLLLQLLDEGQLTDMNGRAASFKDTIVIATSNAGAQSIRERVERGEALESFERQFTDELINSGQFKPELLNRFDEIVLFRPLNQEELAQVVALMMKGVNQTLATQNISVELTQAAVRKIVETGYDPRLGARPMRRALQRAVEDGIAGRILRGEIHPGDHVTLDVGDLAV